MKSILKIMLSAVFTAFCAVLLFTAGCKKDPVPPGGGPNNPKDSSFVVKVTNTCSHAVPNSGTTGKCDGSATANVTGGLQPYKFQWNNGLTTSSVSGLCPGTYVVTVTDGKGSVIKDSTVITHCDTLNPYRDSLHAKVSVTCNNGTSAGNICNGSATVQAGGGKLPYKFQWSNGQNGPVATGLCAGTYKVTITDSTGKSITQVVVIQQCMNNQDSLVVKFNKTCSHGKQLNGTVTGCDGAATVIVNGGTAPYQFQWANGQTGSSATGLCPGTHCVSISDASGLTKKECVMIDGCKDSLPPPPTGNITVTIAPTCSHKPSNTTGSACDGSATAKAAGGTAPYVFQWDNGQTGEAAKGLCAGTYCVTVKDAAGLSAKQCVTIAACQDSMPPPGGLKLTFTATCSHITPNSGAICDGSAAVNVSGGTGPYTYQWSDGQTTQTAKGLCAGTFTVTVTDANGLTLKGTVTIVKCL